MAAADEAPLRRAGRSCASRLFTDAQFRDFTFVNPALLRARMNPDFFKAPWSRTRWHLARPQARAAAWLIPAAARRLGGSVRLWIPKR
jgi:hypothetical protein